MPKKKKKKRKLKVPPLEILKEIGIASVALPIATTINPFLNTYAYLRNRKKPKTTAVFASGYDEDIKPSWAVASVVKFYMYAPITLYCHKHGSGAQWFNDPTKEAVLEALVNSQYENVVFIGHGGKTRFGTITGDITPEEIQKAKVSKKKGFLLQHHCGSNEDVMGIRDVLLEDPTKGYEWDHVLYHSENYFGAWLGYLGKDPSKITYRTPFEVIPIDD